MPSRTRVPTHHVSRTKGVGEPERESLTPPRQQPPARSCARPNIPRDYGPSSTLEPSILRDCGPSSCEIVGPHTEFESSVTRNYRPSSRIQTQHPGRLWVPVFEFSIPGDCGPLPALEPNISKSMGPHSEFKPSIPRDCGQGKGQFVAKRSCVWGTMCLGMAGVPGVKGWRRR